MAMRTRKRANASAKLITAPTGPAAPLIHASAPAGGVTPNRGRINSELNAPVEVTGSPKKQNINTSVGEQVNQGLVTTGKKKGSYVHAGVEYTPEMVNSIVQRGDSGASLNPRQRAVYEQYLHDNRGVKTATETAEAEENRKEQRRQQIRQENNEDQIAKEQRENEEWERRRKILKQEKDDAEAAAAQAAADKAEKEQAAKDEAEELWNGRYGVDAGTRLSKNEKDLIEKGYKVWGYSKADQDVIDQYDATIERAKASGEYSDEEIAALESQKERVTGKYKKTLIDNPNAPTAEQAYGRTFVDENGIRWATDKDGKLTEINTTPKETPEQKAAARKEEAEIKRQERLEDIENKRFDARISELTKEVEVEQEDGQGIKQPRMSYEAAYQQAMREAEYRKQQQAARTATASTAPAATAPVAPATPTSPAPTLTPEQEEEAKKRGYRGKSYL